MLFFPQEKTALTKTQECWIVLQGLCPRITNSVPGGWKQRSGAPPVGHAPAAPLKMDFRCCEGLWVVYLLQSSSSLARTPSSFTKLTLKVEFWDFLFCFPFLDKDVKTTALLVVLWTEPAGNGDLRTIGEEFSNGAEKGRVLCCFPPGGPSRGNDQFLHPLYMWLYMWLYVWLCMWLFVCAHV